MKKQNIGDRLQRNMRRVMRSKTSNFIFPEAAVQAAFADRSKMTAREKIANTNLLKKLSANRYRQLYKETNVQYGEVDYSYKEWKSIPTAERKELESEFTRWSLEGSAKRKMPRVILDTDTGNVVDIDTGEVYNDGLQEYGEIAYANFVDEFLSRLQEPPATEQMYRGKTVKRWSIMVQASEERKATLQGIVSREVARVGKSTVGKRLAQHTEDVDRALYAVLYGSSLEEINTGYTELAQIITDGTITPEEEEEINEQEELNGVYN